jgi:hypothetical protein
MDARESFAESPNVGTRSFLSAPRAWAGSDKQRRTARRCKAPEAGRLATMSLTKTTTTSSHNINGQLVFDYGLPAAEVKYRRYRSPLHVP